MRLHNLALLCASASFIALPAFAQNPEHKAGSATEQTNSSTMPNHNQATESGMGPKQALMHDLKKAGFTNIRIEPEEFVVHATNSQGDPVLMRVTPDAMEAVTAMRGGQNGPEASNNTNGANDPDASSGVNKSNGSQAANGTNGSNAWHTSNGTQESGGPHASVDMHGYNNTHGVNHTGQSASAANGSNNQSGTTTR